MPPTVVTQTRTEDRGAVPGQDRSPLANPVRGAGWLEFVGSFLAIAGVIASVLSGYHVQEWQASASDFKTLYASAQCFRQHIDPYSFRNIAAVFQANHVVAPTSWYAHAPVYPPFTLAIVALLTALPMVPAVYLWMALNGVGLALAIFLLASAAGDLFHLSLPWRLALIALFAASPSLSFSLEMGNVSAIVAALSISAVVLAATQPRLRTLAILALVVALLLKPHLALWVIVALLFRPESRNVAIASLGFFAAVVLCIGLWMAAHHQLAPELASYRTMVQLEVAGGSMAPTNRELIGVAAQITAFASLVGYWLTGFPLTGVNAAVLLILLGALLYSSLRAQKSVNSLLLVSAWSAFGLVATYHRAHDGFVLLLLLPWLLARLRTSWKDPVAILLIGLSFALGIGPSWETYGWLATKHGLAHIATFLLFRQSALVAAILVLLLTATTLREVTVSNRQ